MIRPLGSTSQSLRRIAARAAGVVAEVGECAVFLSLSNRQAYALTRTDPDWSTAIHRNAEHLVGIYQLTVDDEQLTRWIHDDLLAHTCGAARGMAA